MKKFFIFIGLFFLVGVLFAGNYPINLTISSPYGPHPEFNYISYDDLNWKSPDDQIILFNLTVTKTDNSVEENGEIRFVMSWNDAESIEIFKGYELPMNLTNKDIIRASYPGGLFTVEGNLDNVFDELKPLVMDTGRIPDGDYTFSFVVVEEGYGNKPDYEDHKLSNPVSLTFTIKSPMGITLVSPGNPITANPISINTKNPFFVWVSNFDEYTFRIWEETGNMETQDQFEATVPYYTTVVQTSNLDYPPHAPVLMEGKTYAWQVVAKLKNSLTADNSEGEEYQKSKIYHFKISSHGETQNINVIIENYLNRYKPEGWKEFLNLLKNGYQISKEDLDEILARISSGKKIVNIEME